MLLNTVDPGLKIAGVTKNGGNPEVFQYRGPLIKPFRGDGKKHPHPNPLHGRVREGIKRSYSIILSFPKSPSFPSFPKSLIGNPRFCP